MKAICISASNILISKLESTSYKFCVEIDKILGQKAIECEIIDLRDFSLSPCVGCGKCFDSRRCCCDTDFNNLYEKIISSEMIFFVVPHYAPIPAKLCMLLEKMEEIAFVHWWKDNTYKAETCGLPAGIISHGGGSDWALSSYKAMVNDTVANALDTIQCKVVAYSEEWNTGISIPVLSVEETESIFPVQKYDWEILRGMIEKYVEKVTEEQRKRHL